MRILFDSKQAMYKTPFGTLVPGQRCTLTIHIPETVQTRGVVCLLHPDAGGEDIRVSLSLQGKTGAYEIYQGDFSLSEPGLFFYYFQITTVTHSFRLFKQGSDTNMEAGDLWQLSCVPGDFAVPEWAKGAVIYQIFPDRFCKSESPDLTGKLTPYVLHENWEDEVHWRPNEKGEVLNNDFFGGNFRGITEKLDHLVQLGVSILYLNPISKSFSSHRYDTADYKTPDPMLGTEEDFTALCNAAHARGIKVILDGVYSHTGSNSVYFDKEGTFGAKGAYHDPNSPYYSWFTFRKHPDSYACWWDFDTLPTVNKLDPAFVDYIIENEDSVVAHWLKAGADGFRLDVADELPSEFLLKLKKRIRQIRPDALLIGEVWEDASNKVAYGQRRRYFTDGTLDSCMNYPFRTAILNFLRGQDDGKALADTVMTIAENYPPQVLLCNMNLLGTHDTPRILTALVDDFDGSREQLAVRRLSDSQRQLAENRLLVAAFLQYTLPGAPSLYYGDEAGMEGHKDPFNRRTYPWGKENHRFLDFFRSLGQLRKRESILRLGDISFFCAEDHRIGFCRRLNGRTLKFYVNLNDAPWEIPSGALLLSQNVSSVAPSWLAVAPMGFCIVEA